MYRAAISAVLAIALSSSSAFARQVAVADTADSGVDLSPVMRQAFGLQAVAATSSTSLVASAEAALAAASAPEMVAFASPVSPDSTVPTPRPAPWWATTLAVAGPLADGLTTVYAINQSGPNARVVEGNGFFQKLFGADVKPGEIMAFKVGQAALWGAIVHYAGRTERKPAIGVALLTAGVNFFVASRNMRNASTAKRLNAVPR